MRRRAIWLVALIPILAPVAAYALATLTPNTSGLTFAERCVRSAATPELVTLTNSGNQDALDIEISISPATQASAFPLSGNTAWPSLAPDGSISFRVGFVPQVEPTASARAMISYRSVLPPKGNKPSATPSASPSPTGSPSPSPTPSPSTTPRSTSFPVIGSGIDRFVDTSPRFLNFGAVKVGRPAPPQRITIFDDGDTPLSVTRIRLAGQEPGDFSITERGPLTVRDGAPVPFDVAFRPRGPGGRSADLIIESNSCENPTFKVSLAGIGVEPDVIAIPAQVDLGVVNPGKTKRQFFSVANQGGLRLVVEEVKLPDEADAGFKLSQLPSFPARLDPGQSFEVRIEYAARDEYGPLETAVEIMSNDPDDEGRFEVPIVVEVPEPPPSPTPTPSETEAPPPPPPSEGGGFSIPFGKYVGEMAVGGSVVGFFLFLVALRRLRGIPE